MTTTRFILELPQHNSDREGTLMDIRESLTRMIHVSTAIFDRIEAKVQEENQRLLVLQRRIDKIRTEKISKIALQPSKPFTLIHESKLPVINAGTSYSGGVDFEDLFSDFPLQRLGEQEELDDFVHFKNRKNVDEDDDPIVPQEALLDLDRRLAASVAMRIRENLEQINHMDDKSTIYNWSVSSQRNTVEEADEEEMGPPPHSLRNHRTIHDEQELPMITSPFGSGSKDVGYKPSSKEAHNLGLPTTLGGILPDIAEHSIFMRNPTLASSRAANAKTVSPVGGPVLGKQTESPSFMLNLSNSSMESSEILASAHVAKPRLSMDTSNDKVEASVLKPNVNKTDEGTKSVPTLNTGAESDPSRRNLLAEIREGRALASTKSRSASREPRASLGGATSPTQVKHPTSLADEMREKLARRQKALSGERDEEEQLAERRRKGREEVWDEKSSDSGSSLPSAPSLGMPPRSTSSGLKRAREPQPSSKANMPFAGLDALLNRELASKSLVVPRPPPKPASSVGDWEDD